MLTRICFHLEFKKSVLINKNRRSWLTNFVISNETLNSTFKEQRGISGKIEISTGI